MKSLSTSEKICAATLRMLDEQDDPANVTMRKIAQEVGITPMALYKHFADRNALLAAAVSLEYRRLARYFKRAAKCASTAPEGMLGYLNYALDHPNLFRYMFAAHRADAFVYPQDLNAGRSPTLNMLRDTVRDAMKKKRLKQGDVFEVSLTIWAHAHGLVMLYLSGRIHLPKAKFAALYVRSVATTFQGLRP